MSPCGVLATGFASVGAAMLAVELLGRAGLRPFRPLGAIVHAALANRTGRWVVMVVWLWVGFHFLAR